MSNVEPIREGVLVTERQANADVVEMIEGLLAMAKAGEVIGFNGAILYFDGVASRYRAGEANHALAGACHSALLRMQTELE